MYEKKKMTARDGKTYVKQVPGLYATLCGDVGSAFLLHIVMLHTPHNSSTKIITCKQYISLLHRD